MQKGDIYHNTLEASSLLHHSTTFGCLYKPTMLLFFLPTPKIPPSFLSSLTHKHHLSKSSLSLFLSLKVLFEKTLSLSNNNTTNRKNIHHA